MWCSSAEYSGALHGSVVSAEYSGAPHGAIVLSTVGRRVVQ